MLPTKAGMAGDLPEVKLLMNQLKLVRPKAKKKKPIRLKLKKPKAHWAPAPKPVNIQKPQIVRRKQALQTGVDRTCLVFPKANPGTPGFSASLAGKKYPEIQKNAPNAEDTSLQFAALPAAMLEKRLVLRKAVPTAVILPSPPRTSLYVASLPRAAVRAFCPFGSTS